VQEGAHLEDLVLLKDGSAGGQLGDLQELDIAVLLQTFRIRRTAGHQRNNRALAYIPKLDIAVLMQRNSE
jgi:hypothetical protein